MSDAAAYRTPPEIAKLLRIRGDKVLTWIKSGELVAVDVSETVGGRPRWRISQADFEDFLRRRQARPPPKAIRHRRRKPTKSYF